MKARALLVGIGLMAAVPGTPPPVPAPLSYETECQAVAPDSVDGYVTNKSGDQYQVAGVTYFIFSPGTTYQKNVGVEVNTIIPPGQRKLVAHTRPPFVLEKGEACQFDVGGAIRKIP